MTFGRAPTTQRSGKYMWLLTFLLAAGIELIRDNIILAFEHIKADVDNYLTTQPLTITLSDAIL